MPNMSSNNESCDDPKQTPPVNYDIGSASTSSARHRKFTRSSVGSSVDWSPYKDSNDLMQKLNAWNVQCQMWCHFHTNLQFSLFQQQSQANSNPPPTSNTGIIYAIPPLWKRFLAYLIDIFLLYILHSLILGIIFKTSLLTFGKLNCNSIKSSELDYPCFFFVLGFYIISNFIVACIYETVNFYGYPNQNISGGATIGKMVMGLRVVSCLSIERVSNNFVRVFPATNMTFENCLFRSILKYITLYLLPLGVYFNCMYNRFWYDIMCECIVVDTRLSPPNNQQPIR